MSYKDSFEKMRETDGIPGTSGLIKTYLENISFLGEIEPVPKTPMLCKEGIIIIGQGQKVGYLNAKEFRYDEDHIAREGFRISTATDQVGYESLSQFSREFKRYFNISPSSAKDAIFI